MINYVDSYLDYPSCLIYPSIQIYLIKNGDTASSHAAFDGHLPVVKYLLALGAKSQFMWISRSAVNTIDRWPVTMLIAVVES